MTGDRFFYKALLISILLHMAFLLSLHPFLQQTRTLKDIKITYLIIKEELKKDKIEKKAEPIITKIPEAKKEEAATPLKAAPKNIPQSLPEVKKETSFKKIEQKKIEAVIKEEEDEVKKATYISYYRAVREKIKLYADSNYPKNRNVGSGEIMVSFIIASNGRLIDARVIDDKSAKNSVLREIAVNSIQEASPFPPFPEGIEHYQITFSIIISFE